MTRKKARRTDPVQIQITVTVKRPKRLRITYSLLSQVIQRWLDIGEVVPGFSLDAIHWYHPNTGLDSVHDATEEQRERIRRLVRRGTADFPVVRIG